MKKTIMLFASLFFTTGLSLGATQDELMLKKDNLSQGGDLSQNATICQSLGCIADRLELSAKVSYWKKDYLKAIDFYHLLFKAGKNDFDDLYNLACCYGQVGDEKRAAKYLKLAVEEGFTDINHIKSDSDFEKVKNSPKFKEVMSEIAANSDKTDNSETVQTEAVIKAADSRELVFSQSDKN
ncbi:MAG: hypothetical protein AB1798_23690 [Spirochaetota bacterium]